MTKNVIIVNLVVAGIFIIFSCGDSKKPKSNKNVDDKYELLSSSVKTTEAVLSNQEQELTLTGKVEYDPDKVINYVPLMNGIVYKTYFSIGDKVQKGQPLFDIQSTELNALLSEKTSLEAEEKVAERELKAVQSMFDENMLSEKELLEAKRRLRQVQSEINRINSCMNLFGTDKGDGIFTVRAPMSGYVVHKKMSSGSTVLADGGAIFTIADLSTVWITANVYAGNLLLVKEGMEAEITTLSYPDEVFYGKINALSQVFDPEEKVLKARIVMSNKDLKLKPEMSMLVKLKDKTSQRFILIPSKALIFDDNQYFAVVKDISGKFEIRNVTLHGHHQEISYIVSGLFEGDRVVIENQLLIYTGLRGE